jgi:hypothetical protein
MHVNRLLTVFCVTAGVQSACSIRWRTAVMSCLRRARTMTTARSLKTAFPQVAGKIACSELVVRGRVELPTFRFQADCQVV